MRLKLHTFIILLSTLGNTAPSFAVATRFEVAHLAIHRVERLVDLGKIEEKYATAFKSLSLEVLPGTIAAGQPAFRITVKQVANSVGTAKTLQLLADSDGKPVPNDFKELGGSSAEAPPTWPDKLATEITEEALHVVERLKKPEYLVFMSNLSNYSLSQTTGSDGKPRGMVVITAEGTANTLVATMRINASADGDPVVKTLLE